MLKVVLLAAAVAARRDEGRAPKTPIFFFHFHKAGGTSFCELFSRAGLRTPAKMTRRGFEGCNCNTRLLGNNATGHHLKQAHNIDETWRPGGAARMASAMAAAGLDVCMIEESWKFPTPAQLRTFAAEWRALGGVLATSFREPWSRFRSTFLRERGYARATNLTIAQFAKRNYAQTPTGGAVVKYGSFNRSPAASSSPVPFNGPNFYVRLLNGISERPGEKEVVIGPKELRAALEVIDAFEYVFLLEGDLQPSLRSALLGKDVPMPARSNSFFSSAALREHPDRLAKLPPTEYYKRTFRRENCADFAFYYALQNRVHAAGTCVGCERPPADFFLEGEKHPRPRCFGVQDVAAEPSLWGALVKLWHGN